MYGGKQPSAYRREVNDVLTGAVSNDTRPAMSGRAWRHWAHYCNEREWMRGEVRLLPPGGLDSKPAVATLSLQQRKALRARRR